LDAEEASRKFKQADELFRQGEYAQALHLLGQVNDAYPDQRRILYPMALCLEKLEQPQDAPKAQALKARLGAKRERPEQATSIDALQDQTDQPAAEPPPVPKQAAGFNWKPWAIGGGAVLVVAVLALPLFFGDWSGPATESAEASSAETGSERFEQIVANLPELGTGASVFLIVLFGVLQWGFATLVAYVVLMWMGRLIHDDLVPDIIDVAIIVLITTVVSAVLPLLGFIIALIIFSKHYELSCGELLIFVISYLLLSTGLGLILGFVIQAVLLTFLA